MQDIEGLSKDKSGDSESDELLSVTEGKSKEDCNSVSGEAQKVRWRVDSIDKVR